MALSFVLHHSIKSEIEKVKPFFELLESFADAHPLIQSVTKTGEQKYIIRERMPMSFIKFNYKADVFLHNGDEVQYIAYPFFLVLTITFKFVFLKEDGTTVITESVHIKGPPVVSHFLKAAVTYSHKIIVKRIKEILN
ncbi:MAG TPA: hypothetical protein PK289_06465 [Bacteroidia bacterium]|jgi:hypothetical protein|nr:hypothetical protein [Bacteroidia bacterium]HRG53285.1 hypothetical protein [Bacteroidia bacterium]